MKVIKSMKKRCMLTVASSGLSSTMSSLRISRPNCPQMKSVQLTLTPGIHRVHRYFTFTSLYSYSDALLSNSTKSWKKFKKDNHPLFLIVSGPEFLGLHSLVTVSLTLVILIFQKKHGCSNLIKHPLVISLLDYKWKEFGRYIFFGNLLIYLTFLVFLTTFGLVVLSPVERPCKYILYKIFM